MLRYSNILEDRLAVELRMLSRTESLSSSTGYSSPPKNLISPARFETSRVFIRGKDTC